MAQSRLLTVSDDNSVDQQSQKGELVLSGVVLEQGCRVVIADGSV